ncbi:MAG: TerB family tellurite resistance protein [Sphingobacteriales bacterium]|nr:MAG: TerB family tellurite resistance protein [Sphingobacteriales bacterium]
MDHISQEPYTYEKFVLYLYLCAAYSDYQINTDEKDIIREKMATLGIIKPESFDKCWNSVLHDFKQHNDFETMEHIQKCSTQLEIDEIGKMKIFKDLKDIIWADGKEEDTERINMFRFKKILGI